MIHVIVGLRIYIVIFCVISGAETSVFSDAGQTVVIPPTPVATLATRGESDITQGESDTTQGETDITQGESDATQGETDITQGETDITQGESDRGVDSPRVEPRSQRKPVSKTPNKTR